MLLHGGHGSWLHWVRNIEALAARHRVWVADMPGYGDSEDLAQPKHAPDRLRHLVTALAATVDQLPGTAAGYGLVGFSFGGLVAATLAAQHRSVDRLALLGPGGHDGPRPRDVVLNDWRVSDPAERRAALRQNLEVFMLHDPAALDEVALAVHTQACEATRFRSKALSRAGGLHAALDAAHRPTLLAWGEHDVTGVPTELGPTLAAGRPERFWSVLPGAGHWVQYESAAEVNRLLLDWFSGGGGR